MRYSFLLSVYNREKYLAQCISSILFQTYTDFELVIVNDGSTDGSEQIIKSFKDHRIRYYAKAHTGCWHTKNYCIKQAKGDYICFIDSDDFISLDLLENSHRAITQNPDYDYYYPTLYKIVREDGSATNDIWRYVDYSVQCPVASSQKSIDIERSDSIKSSGHRTLATGYSNLIKLFWDRQIGGIPHCASMIRKDVFERFGLFNDTFFNLSDTAYIISNALNIKFLLVPELLTYYNRQHSAQTNANLSERLRTYSEILDEIITKYPTQYFLGVEMDKTSPQFYHICVEKFMSLAEKTEHKEWFMQKAIKYLRMTR